MVVKRGLHCTSATQYHSIRKFLTFVHRKDEQFWENSRVISNLCWSVLVEMCTQRSRQVFGRRFCFLLYVNWWSSTRFDMMPFLTPYKLLQYLQRNVCSMFAVFSEWSCCAISHKVTTMVLRPIPSSSSTNSWCEHSRRNRQNIWQILLYYLFLRVFVRFSCPIEFEFFTSFNRQIWIN